MNTRLVLSLTTAVLAAVLGIIAAWTLTTERSTASEDLGPLDQPVSVDLMARLEKISGQGLTEIPSFGEAGIKSIDTEPAQPGDVPLVLYVGADFCPYCAALRWPLVLTLMRFGDLSGLRYTRSNGRDVYPNTATFTFESVQLKSDLIDFVETELEDRERKPLQKLDASSHELFDRFDTKPYTQYPGSIPFLYLDGKYLEIGSPFSPKSLQGLDWEEIAARLESGDNPVWQDIMAEADLMTAALCKVTQGKPVDACTSPAIEAAAGHLPK